LENRAAALPAARDELTRDAAKHTSERDRASTALLTPFQHTDALRAARALSRRLADELTTDLDKNPSDRPGVVPAATAQVPTPERDVTSPTDEPDYPGQRAATRPERAEQAEQQPRSHWHQLCAELDPRLPGDAHWPVLVCALDRVDAAGIDLSTALPPLFPLPEQNPGRTLHGRLRGVADDAAVERPRFRPGPPELPSTRAANTPLAAARPVPRGVGR